MWLIEKINTLVDILVKKYVAIIAVIHLITILIS